MFNSHKLGWSRLAAFAAMVTMFYPSHAQTVTPYQTNGDQSKLLAKQPTLNFTSTANGTYTITINPSTLYQQMDGFGGAMTDSAAYLIYNKLTASQQSALMQYWFSPSIGLGLNFLRQPMGASDFSAQGNFSYDDVAASQTDVNLTNFSIAKDMTYTIPVLKQAFAINPNIKVELLPWSPPAWMKQSQTMNGGMFNDTYYSSLAQYFVKAIQAYQAQNIPIYAISPQNEPDNTNSSYPTEKFTSAEETSFIGNYLGQALINANLTPKVFAYEHNWDDVNYPETVLGNSAAYSYTAGTSWHCYAGGTTAASQTTVEQMFPAKGHWFTECSGETNGGFAGDLVFGVDQLIIGSTRNWAKAVIEWNLALDQNSGPINGGCTNCRGFVTINTSTTPATITYNVENYVYGQAAMFVKQGAYRIDSNSSAIGANSIEDVAFKNPDGSIALIVLNSSASSQTFDINWAPNNTNFSYTLPSQSVVTFNWMPSTGAAPAAPTNVTATAASSSQINLTWTASTTSGVTYSVYGSTTNGFSPSSSNLITSGVTATSYSNSGLQSGTPYYYIVESNNSNGSSNPSNQATATTTAVAPSAPTSLTATTVSSAQINLSWNASTGTTPTYSLYRATTSGFTPGSGNLVARGLSGTTYVNTGLAPSTTYYYVVRAVNSVGMSASSNQANATTSIAPTGLSSTGFYQIVNQASGSCLDDTGGSVSNGTVLQQYTCYSNNLNQEWKFTATTNGYYEVTTYNSSMVGWDVVGSGQTSGTDVQLHAYSGALNEQFQPVKLSSGYYELIDRNSGLCLNLPNNNNNQQAQVATCVGSISESFTLNLIVASAPAAPTNLTAAAASSSQINLTWTASTTSGVTYSVYGSTTSGFTPGSGNLITSGLTTTTYSTTGLTASTAYYYAVEAVNSNGSSPSSNQATATTQAMGGGGGSISTTAFYQIMNQASASCLDDTGGGTSNGTVLQQYTCYANNLNQQWKFTPTSGGYYQVATHNTSTLVWDVVNVGTSPGTGVQLWTYGGGLNQQWMPVLLSSGYYEFIDRNSGLCLNLPNSNNNQQAQINTCNGTTSEAFKLNQQ
jgi:glucosylceramidase